MADDISSFVSVDVENGKVVLGEVGRRHEVDAEVLRKAVCDVLVESGLSTGTENSVDIEIVGDFVLVGNATGLFSYRPDDVSASGPLSLVADVQGESHLDMSGVSSVRNLFAGSMVGMLDLDGMNLSSCDDAFGMFDGCSNLCELTLPDFGDGGSLNVTRMFSGCSSLSYLDTSCLSGRSLSGAEFLFCGCERLEDLDVSDWDVSEVISFTEAFAGCRSLRELDMSGWDVSSCESLAGMFCDCVSLREVDVSGWEPESVRDCSGVFSNCELLERSDLLSLPMPECEEVVYAFDGCECIDRLDLSGVPASAFKSWSALLADVSVARGATNVERLVLPDGFDASLIRNVCEAVPLSIEGLSVSSVNGDTMRISVSGTERAMTELSDALFSGDSSGCSCFVRASWGAGDGHSAGSADVPVSRVVAACPTAGLSRDVFAEFRDALSIRTGGRAVSKPPYGPEF